MLPLLPGSQPASSLRQHAFICSKVASCLFCQVACLPLLPGSQPASSFMVHAFTCSQVTSCLWCQVACLPLLPGSLTASSLRQHAYLCSTVPPPVDLGKPISFFFTTDSVYERKQIFERTSTCTLGTKPWQNIRLIQCSKLFQQVPIPHLETWNRGGGGDTHRWCTYCWTSIVMIVAYYTVHAVFYLFEARILELDTRPSSGSSLG